MLSVSLHAPVSASFTSSLSAMSSSSSSSRVRIAVVGDVHDQWSLEEDTKALQFLKPDLVLFTGDFGNENVELVSSVAKLEFPKAVILGNHDSWNTQQFSKSKKDCVQLQLECLGDEHVAYRRMDFPQLKLSIVGGRPFSMGGDRLFRKKILSAGYGVEDMDQSISRIYKAASGTPEDHSVVFLAHNGPTGLGSCIHDICGKDWVLEGGDHGDPDLANALAKLKETGEIYIALVVFGHMHKELAYGNGLRKMLVVGDDNTIYLNGAIVPRVRWLFDEQSGNTGANTYVGGSFPQCTGSKRAFTIVEFVDGGVTKIAETWVSVAGGKAESAEEHILYESVAT